MPAGGAAGLTNDMTYHWAALCSIHQASSHNVQLVEVGKQLSNSLHATCPARQDLGVLLWTLSSQEHSRVSTTSISCLTTIQEQLLQ